MSSESNVDGGVMDFCYSVATFLNLSGFLSIETEPFRYLQLCAPPVYRNRRALTE